MHVLPSITDAPFPLHLPVGQYTMPERPCWQFKGKTQASPMKNALYYGDNLDNLRRNIRDESVDLCYIDPPFNSKRNYNQIYTNVGQEDKAQAQAFVDTWIWDDHAKDGYPQIVTNHEGRFTRQTVELMIGLRNVLGEGSLLAYLVSITLRAVEIQRVLSPRGTFFLHCDPNASHYLKLVLDSIFLPHGGNYLNEITWKRRVGMSSAVHESRSFGICTDILLFYAKSEASIFNPQYNKNTPEYQAYIQSRFTLSENGRQFQATSLVNPAYRPNLIYEYKGYKPPKNGWMITKEKMEQWDREGRIYFPKDKGGRLRRKSFADELKGMPIQNLWTDIPEINSQAKERLGYPTQKPEALLERIIKSTTNEGDLVLDAYCGCGTTIAVAQRLNRRWVGIDITYQSISLVLKRLEKDFGKSVADAVVLSGIPKDMESAEALAHKKDDRLRKEFEKWAILTYTNNRAVINEKKGADRGIDGVAYILTADDEAIRMLLQVKSGGVSRGDVAKLRGDMDREGAKLGTLITLEKPTQPMRTEAKSAHLYTHPLTGATVDRISIVTVQDIVESGERLELPVSLEALWKARETGAPDQMSFSFVPARKPMGRELRTAGDREEESQA